MRARVGVGAHTETSYADTKSVCVDLDQTHIFKNECSHGQCGPSILQRGRPFHGRYPSPAGPPIPGPGRPICKLLL